MTATAAVPDRPADVAQHRRERELVSLYATARSLTALGELDDVLQSIVRHAHELIGTDFTYLSLIGPGGELVLRASMGTISAEFLAAHIPRGTGLGGQVIQTRTPQWVEDYLDAAEVTHDSGFDSLVGRENLVALLGVPLLVRGEAIGALFAAHRSRRTFDTDEIATFRAFADHAAVALDNARLYDESRHAVERLETAYRTIEQQVAMMERAETIHEALTDIVLSGGDLQQVAGRLVEHLDGRVTILGATGVPVVSTGDPGSEPADVTTGAIAAVIDEARRSGRYVSGAGESGGFHSAAAIQAGRTHLGVLLLTHAEPLVAIDVRTLERAAHILGLLILRENAVADAAERMSGELLTELLIAGPRIGPTHRARTRARGVNIDALNCVLVADAPTLAASEVSRHLYIAAREWGGLAGEYLGQPTMVVHSDDLQDTVTRIHADVRHHLGRPLTLVAEPVHGRELSRAFQVASRCCALAQAVGQTDIGATSARFALYSMVFEPDRAADLELFIASTLGPLLDHDARRSTQLVATLTAYFAQKGNLKRTADELRVHMNTLLKRLDRIAKVLGEDVRDRDDLDLRIAVRLHELSRSTALAGRV